MSVLFKGWLGVSVCSFLDPFLGFFSWGLIALVEVISLVTSFDFSVFFLILFRLSALSFFSIS